MSDNDNILDKDPGIKTKSRVEAIIGANKKLRPGLKEFGFDILGTLLKMILAPPNLKRQAIYTGGAGLIDRGLNRLIPSRDPSQVQNTILEDLLSAGYFGSEENPTPEVPVSGVDAGAVNQPMKPKNPYYQSRYAKWGGESPYGRR